MRLWLTVIFFSYGFGLQAQSDAHWLDYADTLNKKRLYSVSITATAGVGLSLVALNELWYKDYPKSEFHTFDDSQEWLGVDKCGHGFSSYYGGVVGYHALKWSGVNEKKAIIYGGTWGLIYLTAIEVLDGHSSQWGFSWADMAANATGTGIFIGQQFLWGEQRIVPKFSFHTTQYAEHRPELLGSTFAEQLLKDYNGQTYWLSTNVHSFLREESKFPKWLSISLGYGATGMIGAHSNPALDSEGYPLPTFDRYSQFYFSLDVDLHRIKTKSRLANSLLTMLGWIKIPLPTLELNKNGVEFHPIYF